MSPTKRCQQSSLPLFRHFLRKGENAVYRNNVLTIDYADKSVDMQTHQPPLFGAKLNFALDEVVNCPEYLAYFPLLVKYITVYLENA